MGAARYLSRLRGRASRAIPRLLSHLQPGTRPIRIAELATPLRYDIVIRRKFFELLERNEQLYRNDESAFVELAKETDYYGWFKYIWWEKVHPNWTATDERINVEYRRRVQRSADLYFGIRRNGWNLGHPVILSSGSRIASTSGGIALKRDYYAGDGCHRLAILWSQGEELLPTDYYRVRVYRCYVPIDNTLILQRAGILSETRFLEYLSQFYLGRVCRDESELMIAAKEIAPDMCLELCQVLAGLKDRVR